MARWLVSFTVALLAVLASFVMILWMISPPKAPIENKPLQIGHFVPMSKSSDSQSRSRLREPEPPPELEPPKPQKPEQMPNKITPDIKLDLAAPNIASSISIQAQAMPELNVSASANTQPAPSAPMMTGMDSEVMPLNDVLPEYPDMARRRGIEGSVRLGFVINAQGRVENIQVLESNPGGVFDRSARRAAARWRFTPSTENGVAVPRKAEKTIEFRLKSER